MDGRPHPTSERRVSTAGPSPQSSPAALPLTPIPSCPTSWLATSNALTWHDSRYPERLKQIYDRPPVIYVRGAITEQDDWGIAVVGSRQPTAYGKEMALTLSTGLARSGITVVSGLARGIDSIAHRAALDAGGRTLAIQACGLDMVYPPEHQRLADEIAESGAVISDYPLDTRPRPDFFPRRNRIMSGLTLGTLVVEADEKSGALITAGYALEHNREVFALPGNVTSPKSRGTNRLLQEGAKLVTRIEDVLEELNLKLVPEQLVMQELLEVSAPEADLIKFLSREPIHIDEVTRQWQLARIDGEQHAGYDGTERNSQAGRRNELY